MSTLIEAEEQQGLPAETSLFSRDGFELVQRMAKAFSSSTLVPEQYQGEKGMGNCIIALNMAQRIGSDPLMTMQNLYIVHGKPAWSAQFLIATFNSCGRFSAMRFEFEGEQGKESWGCRAYATELATGERIEGTLVTCGMAKKEGWSTKNGSKWQTMPEQMLRYRAAAWFVRAFAPEIAMGLHTVDEMDDVNGASVSSPARQPRKARVIEVDDIIGERGDGKLFDEPQGQTTAPEDE